MYGKTSSKLTLQKIKKNYKKWYFFYPMRSTKNYPQKTPLKGGGYFFVWAIYYVVLGAAKNNCFLQSLCR